MTLLYHHPLCPTSRLARVLLYEQNVKFEQDKIDYWKERNKLLSIDPLCELPIIKTNEGRFVVGYYPVIEYIINLSENFHLADLDAGDLSDMRRIIYWLVKRFNSEVTAYILSEKLVKLLSDSGSPKTEFLRAARVNFIHHTNYFKTLLQKNGNLVSNNLTVADIFFACHLSVLDYFGEVNWEKMIWLKNWYAPIKSRPSFRSLLSDRISIISPPSYYDDLDF